MVCIDIGTSESVKRSNCCPPEFSRVWSWGFYSPGVCPGGYTSGCNWKNRLGEAWATTPGESAVWCVPSSYACVTEHGGHIISLATPSYGISTNTVPAFQIRWQSSDLSLLEAATSTKQTSSTPSPSPKPSPTAPQGPSVTSPASVSISSTTSREEAAQTASSSSNGSPTVEPTYSGDRNTGALVGKLLGPILGALCLVRFASGHGGERYPLGGRVQSQISHQRSRIWTATQSRSWR
ncbi:hypothetical protein GE09DRAFT_558335 [Coniochaeta sp. 2T2.1]|nr:hypothetical protein GE09DRAFT_558335 [Coniochaeta sp. 2T2.1]